MGFELGIEFISGKIKVLEKCLPPKLTSDVDSVLFLLQITDLAYLVVYIFLVCA